jgi:DAK2 domain fusion protein YloV
VNLDRAREIARAALRNLEANRQRIDDLNVYPVPDGDTGTNLTLTVRAIVEALETSTAEGHEAVARELSRAALMGARGNSGVIFSQIVRGFADVLGERDPIDEPMVARAFRSASDAAYRAVRRPVEGTMLTVIREMAEAAESPEARALEKPELLAFVVARGEESLARTPDLLATLKEAGVVDAGGAGLLEIIRGVHAAVAGTPVPDVAPHTPALSLEAMHRELSAFRYCTVFVIEGAGLDADRLEAELERLGDSLLVVGDASALKVHVHTDDPGAALALGTASGTIDGVEIADMHRQTLEREQRLASGTLDGLPTLETGIVVVAPGEGNRRLFKSLRATRVIEGGQTMNPATEDIVAAVDATPATEVIVLPNNPNVILSAEQAVGLANKPLRVVPTRSVQAGLAAMIAYDPEGSAAENERAMLRAQDGVATGEVTIASRDVTLDGIEVRKGAWLGLADGAAVASGESFDSVAGAVAERLLDGGREILTLLTGAEEPALEALVGEIGERHPEVEIEIHVGGQPHYPLLLSAE